MWKRPGRCYVLDGLAEGVSNHKEEIDNEKRKAKYSYNRIVCSIYTGFDRDYSFQTTILF